MKTSVISIIKDHYSTFYSFRTKKVSLSDWLFQVVIPSVLAIGLNYLLAIEINNGLINIIITSLSIFAGLLLNLLVLIYGISQNSKEAGDAKKTLFNELNANISYGILISVVLILMLIFLSVIVDLKNPNEWIQTAIGLVRTLIWFLLFQFIFSMLMILKRVYVVLRKQD